MNESQTRSAPIDTDVLIIGSGAAGLFAASRLHPDMRVLIVAKGDVSESNTWLAQGGIAAVLSSEDSVESHLRDTLEAGAGLCHEDVARTIIEHGANIIHRLSALGARFDTENGHLHLTREGGHSHRRIAHAQDATGRAIDEALLHHLQARGVPRLERHTAIDLITERHAPRARSRRCLGAWLLTPDERVITVRARHTILATGGAGKAYLYTSNPHAASGDGIAMAWRAGLPVMNMEFIQFHPTCLYHPGGSNLLLSEALRGEGAILVDGRGRRFMIDYDARGELAPRDVVARAIDHEMKKQGVDCVYLDCRPIGEARITRQFPNIRARLAELGIDMLREPVPVVPAAHYLCGGVQAGADGTTALPGLHAIGETACTGLHGANRLASNSLLECLV
ncbi:MAG: L-aspartate oxidase, partial [Mariprofundaceae bacterium]